MSEVKRLYVEKKSEYAVKARELEGEIKDFLGIDGVRKVRVLIRYDIENISNSTYEIASKTVFSEPPVDNLYEEHFQCEECSRIFNVEYLPGQFDQRADSAIQCVQFLNEEEKPIIKTATTYVVCGDIEDAEFDKIKSYCINPVDSREISDDKPKTLVTEFEDALDVAILEGFCECDELELKELYDSMGLAMTFNDFLHIQNYFKSDEDRNPTMTEIKVLDTYWSDHCRHTTFSTELKDVAFEDGFYKTPLETTYQSYLDVRNDIFKDRDDKYICLMDLALLAMRKLKSDGKLNDLEESEEINACSIVVPIEIEDENGTRVEEWLVSFKNETHNHPTEIEPFGGAATCLGGAIRDPLSGRSYVYQAMRVTGAADPTTSVDMTLKGKLPQKKLVRGAANGYSSYGNQIGLATGLVKEIYHPNYVAKRMEIGAVMGAAPRENVLRETSDPGDIIVLLGGRTGRDGCGGATGSSKVHTQESIESCGAEVQKGNAPTERKIQRLFRRSEVSKLIKKCNDFGAGGVSVAIGELADGLIIELDKVPKKYEGLDGTELSISESQERMAVVLDPKDVDIFLKYAAEENLEATLVATVIEDKRLVLNWRGKEIVNLKRAFLDTNGAHQETTVLVKAPKVEEDYFNKIAVDKVKDAVEVGDFKQAWLETLKDLNTCSQKGLVEMFDSSIGAGSVVMPYGGVKQLSETQAMIAKLPLLKGKTDTVTMMSYGFDPYLSAWSPYHGAVYAIVESISKIVASGGDYSKIRFTFQEYFRRMTNNPSSWGEPFAALLGAYDAQIGFGLPSIGGKDSMSGSFMDIDVPPTLVSFAVDTAKLRNVVTPEFKKNDNQLLLFKIEKDEFGLPMYAEVMEMYLAIHELVLDNVIVSAYSLDSKGVASAVSKMAFGNRFGAVISDEIELDELFKNEMGNILVEVPSHLLSNITIPYTYIGHVTDDSAISYKDVTIELDEALSAWQGKLEKVFPTKSNNDISPIAVELFDTKDIYVCKNKIAKPTVFIPVFPGTNCEYDSTAAFERAGANVITKVFKNLTASDIRDSVAEFENAINQSQIIMFPGGFSAGDEPDGSAKFFATAFQNAKLKEAVMELLNERDGLALGICNGFQALIKLGLVPSGEIVGQDETSPTLTFNTINRHISKMVYTKVVSNKSPWLQEATLGGVYANPASHGEGRFVANNEWLERLTKNGQVATQYCDEVGNVSMDENYNVNGSYLSIEGITSEDGRCYGKMAHSERIGNGVAINIYGEQDLKIFESGVRYFR